MMKRNLKHVVAIVLLVGFAAFALGSGSSPSSGGGSGGSSGGSSGCIGGGGCYYYSDATGAGSYDVCSSSKCPAGQTVYGAPNQQKFCNNKCN